MREVCRKSEWSLGRKTAGVTARQFPRIAIHAAAGAIPSAFPNKSFGLRPHLAHEELSENESEQCSGAGVIDQQINGAPDAGRP